MGKAGIESGPGEVAEKITAPATSELALPLTNFLDLDVASPQVS